MQTISNIFRRILCVLAALLFCGQAALAQSGSLTGKVVSKESGGPLPGANVELVGADAGRKLGVICDTTGVFRIERVAPGVYTVKVTFIGYRDLRVEDVVVAEGEPTSLDVVLQESPFVGQELVVSASRRTERALEAPAAVSVIEADDIEEMPGLTPATYLKTVQAVDVASIGIVGARIVVRGFNAAFGGRLLTMADNRITNAPGLRTNPLEFIPITDEDLDRIEVLEGPGSALYGPNAAGGVLHFISKSPFDSKGTMVSVGGGERGTRTLSFRHAGVVNNGIGFKVSGEYVQGHDWEFVDVAEPDSLVKGLQTPDGRVDVGGVIPNSRDFDTRTLTGDARIDLRAESGLTTVLSAGHSRASEVSLTGIAAYQVDDWATSYLQARLIYKDLFLQALQKV